MTTTPGVARGTPVLGARKLCTTPATTTPSMAVSISAATNPDIWKCDIVFKIWSFSSKIFSSHGLLIAILNVLVSKNY